jgi:hypothetical protein
LLPEIGQSLALAGERTLTARRVGRHERDRFDRLDGRHGLVRGNRRDVHDHRVVSQRGRGDTVTQALGGLGGLCACQTVERSAGRTDRESSGQVGASLVQRLLDRRRAGRERRRVTAHLLVKIRRHPLCGERRIDDHHVPAGAGQRCGTLHR